MSKTRKRFAAEFKTRVALDALTGELTLSELASKYGVHANQISKGKKQAKEQVAAGFASFPCDACLGCRAGRCLLGGGQGISVAG